MKFFIDEQLPPAVSAWLSLQGHQAVHVHDLGLGGSGDASIWDHCVEQGAAIITKDRDFVLKRQSTHGPCIVWVRLGNMRTGDLMRRFRAAWPDVFNRLHEAVVELS